MPLLKTKVEFQCQKWKKLKKKNSCFRAQNEKIVKKKKEKKSFGAKNGGID